MGNKKWFHKNVYLNGVRDGIPIALGYFAVSFTLGITMRNAGLNWVQGFFTSLLNNASAGEYAGISMIAAHAPYFETALMTLIANARYFLMSCAFSQKLSPDTSLWHRMLIGFDITDELFGISIAQKGYLDPSYYYGAMSISIPAWAIGTALGVIAGNVLPMKVVQALSVALYGMFLVIIIPPAKKNKIILVLVLISFALSYLCGVLPFVQTISEGTRTIVLTVLIAGVAATFFPHKEDDNHA